MNTKKLYTLFEKIESTENLLGLFTYNETNSWINVKYGLFRDYFKVNQVNKKNQIKLSLLIPILKNILNSYSNRKSKSLYFGTTRGLVVNQKNEIKDIYSSEEIFSPSEVKTFMTLNSFNDLKKNSSFLRERRVSCDNLYYNILAKINFSKSSSKINFSELKKEIDLLGLDIDINLFYKLHNNFINQYKFYDRLLSKYKKVKNAYIVSSHSKSFITAVLQKRKISVIEIQHGIVGNSHIGFDFKCEIHHLPIPNKIYVYNEFWKKELLNCNFTKDIQIFKYYKYQNIFPEIKKNQAPYILFTGQGLFYDEIQKLFMNGIEFLKRNKITFHYRPHPSETSSLVFKELSIKYPHEFVYNTQEYSTEYLIKHAVAHISVQSTCHFDCVEILGKTHILDITWMNNPLKRFTKSYPENFVSITKLNDLEIL